MQQRRKSRKIFVGDIAVGGDAPVSIQSMTNTKTDDVGATVDQIGRLTDLGCQIIRVAVPDMAAADALTDIVKASPLPVIADIHFDHQLALRAIAAGVAAVRVNPGNIDSKAHLKLIAEAARDHNIVIRVGANSGSVRPNLIRDLRKQGIAEEELMAEALVKSAMAECVKLEEFGFTNIKVALKSSGVVNTVKACRMFAARTDYPLHLGVTEAGIPGRGIVKSAVGIGALLLEGIGDTLRVSLTASPEEEVITARRILEACELREACPEIISCPTCGRTEIDLIGLTNQVEDLVDRIKGDGYDINLKKIAVMGCAVNGPGEARDADLGLAGSKNGKVIVFRFGEIIGAFDSHQGFEFLRMEIMKYSKKGEKS